MHINQEAGCFLRKTTLLGLADASTETEEEASQRGTGGMLQFGGGRGDDGDVSQRGSQRDGLEMVAVLHEGHVERTGQPFSRPTLHLDSSEEKAHRRWILLPRLKMDSGERGRRPALEADVIRVVQSVTQSALSPAVCAQSGGGGRKPFHRFRVHVRHPEPHIISAAPQMRAFTG